MANENEEEKQEILAQPNIAEEGANGHQQLPDEEDFVLDEYFMERLVKLKQHSKYKMMLEKGCPLSDYELIAVIYYCDRDQACWSIKKYHKGLEKSCKWRNLYYHLDKAVDKLHQCFHFRNADNVIPSTLFHGSSFNHLDPWSEEQLFLRTITYFTWDINVAYSFAKQGSINADGLI